MEPFHEKILQIFQNNPDAKIQFPPRMGTTAFKTERMFQEAALHLMFEYADGDTVRVHASDEMLARLRAAFPKLKIVGPSKEKMTSDWPAVAKAAGI